MFFDNIPQGGVICAHRGARSIAPENTLLALHKAKECGAHCWETDVRMSKDGELIIFHDSTLQRTTDIATHAFFEDRSPWPVEQFTADELRELDAGSWFLTDDPFGSIASGEVSEEEQKAIHEQKIPLLREVLEFSKTHHFPVNLEIKDIGTPPGDVIIVDKIIDMLRQTETVDIVLLSSFRYEYLQRARALHSTVDLAVLAEDRHPVELIKCLDYISAAAYHPSAELCDPHCIHELRQAGFRVNNWVVNDIIRAKEMIKAGIGVITDWPQRLTPASDNRRSV